jgi:hypothetical protein
MMFSFSSRREDQISPHQALMSKEGVSFASKSMNRLRKVQRARGGSSRVPAEDVSHFIDEMNVNETKQGIEVSLDFISTNKEETREPPQLLREPVISVKEQIRQRQKVYRAQFSVSFPVLQQASSPPEVTLDNWRPKDHRIPLLGYSLVEMSYDDVLSVLQTTQVTDEYSAVQEELKQMSLEVKALDKDRTWLETSWRKMTNSVPNQSPSKSLSSSVDWDVRRLLESSTLGKEDRARLQKSRGRCMTVHLQNPKAKESLLAKCGCKSKGNKRRTPGDTITLSPDNCRQGGAAAPLQHVSILSNDNGTAAFFLSRDAGKSYTWGRLPPKLFRRMKQEGMDASNESSELVYLSTGPQGCYFAEFRSGESWWGNAVEDHDFHSIIQSWDVYRVVFGPIIAFEDERGNKRLTNSWIILGCDGRAAWKNLPSRLHHRLESRVATWAAPAEVALGPGDSYYIRFLDGTVDYCLPAMMADVCEHIEHNGGKITNIALHPEISYDFVIRHTEMRK